MPSQIIHGTFINYEVIGSAGPWLALTPGSRRPYDELRAMSRAIAAAGYRVLLHDRRNCGKSDVIIEGQESENEIWSDDLAALLAAHDGVPAYVGGSSAGCRLSILLALRHRAAVKGLLLWRVTGGRVAAEELAESYYGQYVAAAKRGGMAAVCATEHFRERIEARPENGERLLRMQVADFIETMGRWRDDFIASANKPVIGATEEQVRSLAMPVCLVPGNDRIHTPETVRALHRLLPQSEVHDVVRRRPEGDLLREWDRQEWQEKEPELARLFVDFMQRHGG